eukprot:TRINITY_DN26992_c0_g1_i1.p1 TRINITY_DN26992_c0_g1~~TRINITY_DN26992_c0_g1_i1.p1  ORF type:complete len:707 (-),score=110.39 TRINITY_DN26992_c0_g1_i1:28-2055(-)
MDEACWADGTGYTWEVCCGQFPSLGHPGCWSSPAFTFQRCCLPESISTAAAENAQLILQKHERAYTAISQLQAAHRGSPGLLEIAEGTGSGVMVTWRQGWSCPPDAARDRVANISDGGKSCAHDRFDDQGHAYSKILAGMALESAHSAPGDDRHIPPLSGLLRLSGALAEFDCLMRWWKCFDVSEEVLRDEILAQVCSIIDLSLMQLAAGLTGVNDALSQLFWRKNDKGGACARWTAEGHSLREMIQAMASLMFDSLDNRMKQVGDHTRWTALMRSVQDGNLFMMIVRPEMRARPPGNFFYHFSDAVEFNPICGKLKERPTTTPFFTGSWDRPWLDSTFSLTWHLFITDVIDSLRLFAASKPDLGLSWTVVNLGAEDGGCNHGNLRYWMVDPANCLLETDAKFGGVLVEGDPETMGQARERYRGRADVLCSEKFITPENVKTSLLSATPCDGSSEEQAETKEMKEKLRAGDIDLLKIDVDDGDCDFLEAMVPWLRPKVIHAEMNPHFPPPWVMRQNHVDGLIGARREPDSKLRQWVRGCSLSGISQAIGGPSKYVIVQVEFDHALFVRRDWVEALPLWSEMKDLRLWDHWLAGYQCHALRRVDREDERELGYDFRKLVSDKPISDADARKKQESAMRDLLIFAEGVESAKGSPRLSIVNGRPRIPFTLEVCESCG